MDGHPTIGISGSEVLFIHDDQFLQGSHITRPCRHMSRGGFIVVFICKLALEAGRSIIRIDKLLRCARNKVRRWEDGILFFVRFEVDEHIGVIFAHKGKRSAVN